MKKLLLILTPLIVCAVGCDNHQQHTQAHDHTHQAGCGHVAVTHDGHSDYLHDGHLHHVHSGHVDEHVLAVNASNPNQCTPGHEVGEQPAGHIHGADCGHAAVPHGDHVDYLVSNHLHHAHGDHCDDHGPLLASK